MFQKIKDLALAKGYQMLRGRKLGCPDCGTQLSLPETLPTEGFSAVIHCSSCAWSDSLSSVTYDRDRDAVVKNKPAKSRIRESVGVEKATWLIPAKKGINFLLFFAVFWLGVTSFFSYMLWFGDAQLDGGASPLLGKLFVLPFWIVGLGIFYGGLRMSYTDVLIRIDAKKVVLTRSIINRRWHRDIDRKLVEGVELSVSHTQNNRRVYQLEVENKRGGSIKFGSGLTDDEKNWMLGQLREFLRIESESQAVGYARQDEQGKTLPHFGFSELKEMDSKALSLSRIGHDGFRITQKDRCGPWLLIGGALIMVGSTVFMSFFWADHSVSVDSSLFALIDLLFTAVPVLIMSIMFLVALGLMIAGYRFWGRRKTYEFSRRDLVFTELWRSKRKQARYAKADFLKTSKKVSGRVNDDPRYKLTLTGKKQSLKICSFENAGVTRQLEEWLNAWLQDA